MTLRIGSLFTGTGALDLAVMDVFDADVVWHSQYEPPDKNGKEDKYQYAARILNRHWPTVPNLGDVTKVCWQCVIEEHGRPHIVTGGFPCTDVSSAGKRAGLTPDTRSGLWSHMAYAVSILQPRLVIIENVEGLLSAPADRGLGLDAEALEEEARTGRILRALGAVLGDLASLGFDAEWARVAASEVGAPHARKRVFIYAWPADADPADLGHERGRDTRRRGNGPADSGVPAAHTCRAGLEVGRVEPDGSELPTAERGRRQPAADADSVESERRGVAGALGSQAAAEPREGGQRQRTGDAARHRGQETAEPVCPTCGCGEWMHDAGGFCAGCRSCTDPELGRPGEVAADTSGILPGDDGELPAGRDAVQQRVRNDAPRCGTAAADTSSVGRDEGRAEPAGQQGRPDAAQRSGATPADADYLGRRADVLQLRPGQPDLDWGDYGPAIRRWEHILGRPAPWPTDALGRLSAVFTEWLMGLPDGWVTATPGLTRAAMLRALGNGVVPQQAAAAIRLLHTRATEDTTTAAA